MLVTAVALVDRAARFGQFLGRLRPADESFCLAYHPYGTRSNRYDFARQVEAHLDEPHSLLAAAVNSTVVADENLTGRQHGLAAG